MDKIRVLPDGVANQIAAGEVVGRPASVVKELMENAVDAGSTSVTVHFKEGGRSLIQVVDNGCGMSDPDARLAFERHATSKIRTAEDLYRLRSFGFRGEALPSIASVAEVELRTRTTDRELGTRVVIHGGAFVEQVPVQASTGTQLLVKNLFYNVPPRRRFLKEAHIEARHLTAEFQRVALCNPHIAFTLYSNENPLYNLPVGNLRQRIAGVHGKALANHLLEVSVETSLVSLEGFTGHPSLAKKSSREQYLFVNGRYFRSPYFHKAVLSAYEKLIPADTQPPYFLYLKVDPERVDVNVHPSKTEVKFDDEQALWQIINAAVRESLGKLGVVPLMDFELDPSVEIPVYREGTAYKMPGTGFNPGFNPFAAESAPGYQSGDARSGAEKVPASWSSLYERDSALNAAVSGFEAGERAPETSEEEWERSLIEFIKGEEEPVQGRLAIEGEAGFRGLLRVDERFYAMSLGDALVLVDAGRAYERVLYERYRRMTGHNTVASQQLLFPERIELDPEAIDLLKKTDDQWQALGFEYNVLPSGDAVEITGAPSEIAVGMLGEVLREWLDALGAEEQSPREERLRRMTALLARRGALSSRESFSGEGMEALLRELFEGEEPNHTPFGLPILSRIPHDELVRRFNR